MQENTMKKHRVGVCEHTQKKIVQVEDGNGWLCLHKENEALDEMIADAEDQIEAGQRRWAQTGQTKKEQ